MQSKIMRIALAAMLFVAAPIGALAQNVIETPDQSFYSEGDFKLGSGEVIRDFKISYVRTARSMLRNPMPS